MSLRDQFNKSTVAPVMERESRNDPAYFELKNRIHRQLLENADLTAMESMSAERLRDEIRSIVQGLLQKEHALVNDAERRQIVSDIQNEVLGLGPLEPLLADPTISDILANTADAVFVERRGRLEKTDIRFTDNAHLLKIIDKIVSRIGRRVDESSPMVDARLPDGSRVNAIIPPLAIDGPILSIRRFSVTPLMMHDLIGFKSLTEPMAKVLHGLVQAKVNMLISGGTGSGKTTLLNAMSAAIPHNERIVTIEDAAELQLQQPHVVRLETRPPNIEGKGEVTQRALVRNSLRMRPDRIIVGEVRGAEALDMMQAMNTGHEGSLTTIHANSPRDALTRLENMVSMAGLNLPTRFMRQQIASAISVVVQVSRLSDGHRRITSIQEVTGMEGDIVSMQEIFTYEQTGVTEKGEVQGYFRATGIRPKFIQRLHTRGVDIEDTIFDPSKAYS
ncbi:MAG TPA: CpaF family protein [Moraxellaceae bacterium]|nr:CpaF family protein [Moraxellaceae bacterium]